MADDLEKQLANTIAKDNAAMQAEQAANATEQKTVDAEQKTVDAQMKAIQPTVDKIDTQKNEMAGRDQAMSKQKAEIGNASFDQKAISDLKRNETVDQFNERVKPGTAKQPGGDDRVEGFFTSKGRGEDAIVRNKDGEDRLMAIGDKGTIDPKAQNSMRELSKVDAGVVREPDGSMEKIDASKRVRDFDPALETSSVKRELGRDNAALEAKTNTLQKDLIGQSDAMLSGDFDKANKAQKGISADYKDKEAMESRINEIGNGKVVGNGKIVTGGEVGKNGDDVTILQEPKGNDVAYKSSFDAKGKTVLGDKLTGDQTVLATIQQPNSVPKPMTLEVKDGNVQSAPDASPSARTQTASKGM